MLQKMATMHGPVEEGKGSFVEFQEDLSESGYEAMKSSIYGSYHTNHLHCQRQAQFNNQQFDNINQNKRINESNNESSQNLNHSSNQSSHQNSHHGSQINIQNNHENFKNSFTCSSRTVYPHYSSCMASQLFSPLSNRERRKKIYSTIFKLKNVFNNF